jgi:predicted Zn-dependent protease
MEYPRLNPFAPGLFAAFGFCFLVGSTVARCEPASPPSLSGSGQQTVVEGDISGLVPEPAAPAGLELSIPDEKENPLPNPKTARLAAGIAELLLRNRPDEAEAKFKQLEQIAPGTPILDSLQAAIMVGKRDYNGARAVYAKITARDPKAFFPRFNMVELYMLESRYEEARKGFIALLDLYPGNQAVLYKILLACLKENKRADADTWLARLNQPPVTAFTCYGNAAAAIADNNLGVARAWMIQAENDYKPGEQRWLHAALEGIGYAVPGDYPPR